MKIFNLNDGTKEFDDNTAFSKLKSKNIWDRSNDGKNAYTAFVATN